MNFLSLINIVPFEIYKILFNCIIHVSLNYKKNFVMVLIVFKIVFRNSSRNERLTPRVIVPTAGDAVFGALHGFRHVHDCVQEDGHHLSHCFSG